MARMMVTGAMTLALIAATPAFAGEPLRLSASTLDQVTAGGVPGDAGSSFDTRFGIPAPGLPALGEPDDDIWDLLGSGVVGQGALLERFRGFLQNARFRRG